MKRAIKLEHNNKIKLPRMSINVDDYKVNGVKTAQRPLFKELRAN